MTAWTSYGVEAIECEMWVDKEHYKDNRTWKAGNARSSIAGAFQSIALPVYYNCGVEEYLYQMFDQETIEPYEPHKKFVWYTQKNLTNAQEVFHSDTYECAFRCK